MKKIFTLVVLLMFFVCEKSMGAPYLDEKQIGNYIPENGIISDEKMAMEVGEIVLKRIYVSESIELQKPLRAKLLRNTVWIVSGSLGAAHGVPYNIAYIKLRKKDGAILGVTHEK